MCWPCCFIEFHLTSISSPFSICLILNVNFYWSFSQSLDCPKIQFLYKQTVGPSLAWVNWLEILFLCMDGISFVALYNVTKSRKYGRYLLLSVPSFYFPFLSFKANLLLLLSQVMCLSFLHLLLTVIKLSGVFTVNLPWIGSWVCWRRFNEGIVQAAGMRNLQSFLIKCKEDSNICKYWISSKVSQWSGPK